MALCPTGASGQRDAAGGAAEQKPGGTDSALATNHLVLDAWTEGLASTVHQSVPKD